MNIVWISGVGGVILVLVIALGLMLLRSDSEESPQNPILNLESPLTEQGDSAARNERVQENSMYTHPKYKYSFLLLENMEVYEQEVGNASASTLFINTAGTFYFSVFATPYGKTEISQERLDADLEGGSAENFQAIYIGPQKMLASMFIHTNNAGEKFREVWLIHDNYLYEFSAPENQNEYLASVLATLTFSL